MPSSFTQTSRTSTRSGDRSASQLRAAASMESSSSSVAAFATVMWGTGDENSPRYGGVSGKRRANCCISRRTGSSGSGARYSAPGNLPNARNESRKGPIPLTAACTAAMSASDNGEVRQGQSNVTCGGMPSIAAEVNPYHAEMIGPASGTRMSIDDSPSDWESGPTGLTVDRCVRIAISDNPLCPEPRGLRRRSSFAYDPKARLAYTNRLISSDTLSGWCPRQDLNLCSWLRRPVLYPG